MKTKDTPQYPDMPEAKPSLAGSRTLRLHTPEDDRPREKARTKGFEALSTAELLAIIVRTGTPGQSVVELCQKILTDNDGKLYEIARRGIAGLAGRYAGIGEVKAIEILACMELARRYQLEKFEEKPQITSSDDAYRYLRLRMEHLDHEQIHVLLLNRSKRVIGCERISSGGTSMTVADVKMIMRCALENLADGIILSHNHPGDTPNPSALDDRLTDKVAKACAVMDVTFVDHIIVCRAGRYYSYMDHGKIS